MNRIRLGPLATMSPASRTEFDFESRAARPRSTTSDHSVFIPLHYEKNYAYPLVVWLHDRGSNEAQLADIMSVLSLRNYVAVAPRGPSACGGGGFDWSQTASSIENSDQSIAAAIDDSRQQFNIASQRIFLAGIGTGGTMAFRIALQRPEWFGGVLSINGSLPAGSTPLVRLNACRRLPIFWTHCRADDRFSESELAMQLRVLHIGGFQVTLRQYPSGNQRNQILPDANRWMMDLITRPATTAS